MNKQYPQCIHHCLLNLFHAGLLRSVLWDRFRMIKGKLPSDCTGLSGSSSILHMDVQNANETHHKKWEAKQQSQWSTIFHLYFLPYFTNNCNLIQYIVFTYTPNFAKKKKTHTSSCCKTLVLWWLELLACYSRINGCYSSWASNRWVKVLSVVMCIAAWCKSSSIFAKLLVKGSEKTPKLAGIKETSWSKERWTWHCDTVPAHICIALRLPFHVISATSSRPPSRPLQEIRSHVQYFEIMTLTRSRRYTCAHQLARIFFAFGLNHIHKQLYSTNSKSMNSYKTQFELQ